MDSLDALEAVSNALASVLPLTAVGSDLESTGRDTLLMMLMQSSDPSKSARPL